MTTRKSSRERRAGRFRRWILRPAIWILVLVAVLFAASLWYLESPLFAERARRAAERRLTAALGREVNLGGLELDLVPFAVTVSDLAVAGPAPGAEPLLTLARASVEAEPRALLGRGLDLRHVHLLRPRLRIGFDANGEDDLPRLAGGAGRAPALALRFGSIEIDDGEFVLDDDRTPIDLSAREVRAVFAGVGDGIELRGRAESTDLGLLLSGGRPYDGRIEIHGVIRRHRLDLTRVEFAGPDLTARAAGYWRWHGDRELALDLEADGDLAVLGRLGYLEGRLVGPVRFAGGLTRKPGVVLLDGEASSRRATVFDRLLTGLETRLHLDTNALTIAIERAEHAGGGVSGAVNVGLAAQPGRVDLDLRLDRVGLGQLLADLAIPVAGLSGGVSGVLNYQFDAAAPDSGNGWADLVIADERAPAAGDLPVTGTVPLAIGRGVVRSDALRLAGPSFRLTAGGDFDLATGRGAYDFELDADAVSEVMDLVPGGDGEGAAAAWRPAAGHGRASGRLSVGPGAADLRLILDLAAVEAPGLVADTVGGLVAIDGGGVRELWLEATRPGGALIVSGAVPFDEAPTAAFPFRLAIDAADWPLEAARVWLPFELPLAGPFTGVVELGVPNAAEGVSGRFAGRLAPVRWQERQAAALAVEAEFDPGELRLAEAELALAGGSLSARGRVGFEDLDLDLELESTPLALGALLDDGEGTTGGLSGRLSGRLSGTAAAPELAARLDWVGGEPDDALEVEWSGGELAARGAVPGIAALAGGGRLSPAEVDLELALGAGRVAGLVALAAPATPELGLGGEFSGRILVSGRLDPEVELTTAVILDRLTTRLPPIDKGGKPAVLSNLEPVVVEVAADGLRLRSLYLGDAAGSSELFVGGRVGAAGELDLQLQTAIAADWLGLALARVWPEARWSAGTFDAIATVDGDLFLPRLNGVGQLRGGRLVADGLPAAIDDLAGTVLFYRDQVVVDSVTARAAGGTVRAGGVVPLTGDGPPAFRFQAAGERLSYRSPDGWTARGGAEVTLSSTPDGQLLSGSVTLEDAVWLQDVKLGLEQLLTGLFGAQRLEVEPTEGWRAATQLNLRLAGDRALRVRNNVADLRGSADLVVRGTMARPVIFGSVEVEPGGRLEYAGADYRVERGQLSFTNPYRIQPAIDLVARTELREYDITLNLAGTPDRLALDFSSNPPLADLDVLGLLSGAPEAAVAAVDPGDSAADTVGAGVFLYGQATSLIAQRFNRLFGLDKFRIDPLTSSTGDLSSARVTVGKRLTRNLLVTYSYDPSSTAEQVLELDWNVTRNLVLVLTQNGDGTYAVDALWERAF